MTSFEGSSEADLYEPPAKIEDIFSKTAGNAFAAINAPTAGARSEEAAPEGSAPFQLYSLFTPNGIKVGIMLEELGIEYDAHTIMIGKGDQFKSFFVDANPNSKIPCAVDRDGPGGKPVRLFESGAIVLYLAEKYGRFMPTDPALRAEAMNWIMWQVGGQGPFTGQFGHFFVYAPQSKKEACEYGISRYGMETLRLCDVLERHLAGEAKAGREYMVGGEYSAVDMMIFPWFQQLRNGYKRKSELAAKTFLGVEEKFPVAVAWADKIAARPAVQRGMQVCSPSHPKPWLKNA